MLSKLRIIVFIVLTITFYGQSLYSQSKENVNDLKLKKEQLKHKNQITKHKIDSLKNVLKNLDAKLKKHLKKLYILKYGKKKGIRVYNGSIWKGMTEDMLRDSWGKPDRINKIKRKWGVFTQWYYGDITYFFKNGKLTDWEENKKGN